jgi:hypothetical protein
MQNLLRCSSFQTLRSGGGESVLTWKSPLSIGFDVVLGVLPAIYFAVVSLIFLFDSELHHTFNDLLGRLTFFGIGLSGLVTTLSLIYVTFAREHTANKFFFKIILGFGIFLAIFVPLLLWILNLIKQISLNYSLIGFITALEIPIVIVAIKHIYLLSRA